MRWVKIRSKRVKIWSTSHTVSQNPVKTDQNPVNELRGRSKSGQNGSNPGQRTARSVKIRSKLFKIRSTNHAVCQNPVKTTQIRVNEPRGRSKSDQNGANPGQGNFSQPVRGPQFRRIFLDFGGFLVPSPD